MSPIRTPLGIVSLLGALALGGCAGTPAPPQTRTVVNFTGQRIQADPEAMVEVDKWLRPQLDDIERNPGFLIRLLQEDRTLYPWETLEITGDTAQLSVQRGTSDAETPFLLYAHFRLMSGRPEMERWLPEGVGLEGVPLEVAILERIAQVWLLGRSVFDTSPYGPLDEILYAREGGFLQELVLATQTERFAQERDAYFAEQPEREEAFRSWFLRTFEREGPGFLPTTPPTLPAR